MKSFHYINFVQKALVLTLSTKAKMKTGVSLLIQFSTISLTALDLSLSGESKEL
jgi:hypothetical protein